MLEVGQVAVGVLGFTAMLVYSGLVVIGVAPILVVLNRLYLRTACPRCGAAFVYSKNGSEVRGFPQACDYCGLARGSEGSPTTQDPGSASTNSTREERQ